MHAYVHLTICEPLLGPPCSQAEDTAPTQEIKGSESMTDLPGSGWGGGGPLDERGAGLYIEGSLQEIYPWPLSNR